MEKVKQTGDVNGENGSVSLDSHRNPPPEASSHLHSSPLISFVLPFYKRFEVFNQAIEKNYLFYDERVEIVLVLAGF